MDRATIVEGEGAARSDAIERRRHRGRLDVAASVVGRRPLRAIGVP